MRRFVTLAVILLFALPFGASLAGCHKGTVTDYCNGQNSGVVVGQLTTLDLEPRLTGISLNQGQIGQTSSPGGRDCKGGSVSPGAIEYGTTDVTLVDIVPNTGRLCAGSWNRQTGGGIPDYTVCTPTARTGTAFITASAGGVSSNPIPVYVHAVVTSIVLGPPSANCDPTSKGYDPASNCYNTNVVNGACMTTPVAITAAYTGTSCLSQGASGNLVARTFKGTDITLASNNISCQVGPIAFGALNPNVVTIDTNGLATATAPGSTIINASTSQSSSTAGFFSTCPPASIVISTPGSTTPPAAPLSVAQNTNQTLVATVTDTNGKPITNLQLVYVSTSPVTIPATGSVITPTYPSSAAIYAICEPPACNAAPFNEIGLYGNGTAVTSNPVQINATGTATSTILYIASTNSQYVQPVDFTLPTQPSPLRLPYQPNSMVISQDLSSIYMGSAQEIMTLNVSNSTISLARQDTTVVGTVLAVSPDSSTVVITDSTRNLTYLYGSGGQISSEYGGTGVQARWSPDSQTVYITTNDGRMLVHSSYTGWTAVPLAANAPDLTVTVPNAGVYLAGNTVTGRTNCPTTLISNPGTGFNQTTSNTFYPLADTTLAVATNVAATNDGLHVLSASSTNFTDIATNNKSGGCPVAFTSTTGNPKPFTGAVPTSIVNILPTTDSSFALITYLGAGGVVPQYAPGTGILNNVPLQKTAAGTPIAPVYGVLSSDNQSAFIGTSGDNLVHRLTRGTTGFTDTLTPVTPALPGFTGGTATPNLLVQRPRKTTS